MGPFCRACKKSDAKLVSVSQGVSALIEYSKLRKDGQLEQFLEESLRLNIQVYVHEEYAEADLIIKGESL